MNERIRQLAEQAGFTEGGYESDEGPWIGPEFNKEKFAQLIIQECTEICDEVQRRFGQYTFTARVCKEEIKEHFGVEL